MVFFVARAKKGMAYVVVENRPVPKWGRTLPDRVIRLAGARGRAQCPYKQSSKT